MEEQVIPVSNPAPALNFKIAGFWRRVFAYLIDIFLVSIPFGIIGSLFFDFAVSLGPWGHTATYIALVAYFSYFDSNLRRGQSIGKKAMKIRVVQKDGTYLSPKQALIRSLLIIPIGMLNNWMVPIPGIFPSVVAGGVLLGGGLSLGYAFVFNRTTRQGIHDLLTRSYVVEGEFIDGVLQDTPTAKRSITYGLFVLGLGLSLLGYLFMPNILNKFDSLSEMSDLQTSVLKIDGVNSAGVQRYHGFQAMSFVGADATSSSQEIRSLIVTVNISKSCTKNEVFCRGLIKKIALMALNQYPDIDQLTHMRIVLIYGFDLGLANGSMSMDDVKFISDWRLDVMRDISVDDCALGVQQQANKSEHIILEDVYWNNKLATCFIVTRHPHLATQDSGGSDWAINLAKKDGSIIVEAETYALLDTSKTLEDLVVLSNTYSYENLEEYLKNPNKQEDWKRDFFKQVEQYR